MARQSRIGIIGTGLIGTSLGLNLMARKDRQYEVIGADRDRGNARTAKKMGAIDREVGSLEELASETGLVIIAVPVGGARRILSEIGPLLPQGAVVTDTCSTKKDILDWAALHLPEHIHFVGGHPMAGKEKSGPEAAAIDLFKGAQWAVTPPPKTSEEALNVVLGMVESTGANPLYIDAAEHDQYVAAVSHLPILISVALFRMMRDSKSWEDASLLAGPGFRDLTRLASGDPTMSKDIMVTNRDAIIHWLNRYQAELDLVRKALEAGTETMVDLFASTQLDRDSFILNPPMRRQPEGPPAPSAQDAIGQFFVGGLYDKMKDLTNRMPTAIRDQRALKKDLGVNPDDEF